MTDIAVHRAYSNCARHSHVLERLTSDQGDACLACLYACRARSRAQAWSTMGPG
jgi:hypothetical protein